jgi:NADH-quinone oxidoreductase subunit N
VQTDVKRMMAYSSINHAGFVLVGVQAATERGVEAALFYLATYTFLIAGTFGVITLVGRRGDGHHRLDDYRGLGRTRPGLALVMAVFLFAQAGVPLTSGFFAKFYVITAAVDAGSTSLAVIAMLSTVISAFLYLRITVSLYMSDPEDVAESPRIAIPVAAGIALALCVIVTLVAGVWPDSIAEIARDAVPVLTSVS